MAVMHSRLVTPVAFTYILCTKSYEETMAEAFDVAAVRIRPGHDPNKVTSGGNTRRAPAMVD